MASIKALAAIAITLMIAVPIGLGYAFASEDVEVTTWEAESTTNVSDLLLNSTTPYYTTLNSQMNNYELMEKVLAGGATITSIVAPSYNTVSSNYTSIRETSSGSGSANNGTATTTGYTVPSSGSAESFGSAASGAGTVFTDYDRIYMNIVSTSYVNALHWELWLNGSQVSFESSSTTFSLNLARDGAGTWSMWNDTEGTLLGSNISTWMFYTDAAASTVSYTGKDMMEFDPGVQSAVSFQTTAYTTFMLTHTDSSVTYVVVEDANTSVTWTDNSTALIGSTTYSAVSGMSLAMSSSTIYYTYAGPTGNYVDPADGWQLPAQGSAMAIFDWWFNEQYNKSVTFMIDFDSTTTIHFGITNSVTTSQMVEITYDGTITTVDGLEDDVAATYLGNYTKLMMVLTTTGATVYGLTDWPTMGTAPTTYNKVELEWAEEDEFFYVNISALSRSSVNFRVDSAEIVAGTYPITNDYYFRIGAVFPAQSYEFTVKSVAIAGDEFIAGNKSFTVADGNVTGTDIDGESFSVKLRGMKVREIYDPSGYTVSINDHVITTTGTGWYYFGGDWSITATVEQIAETTSTQQTWAPGEFAFEKEDFAACGLLVAGALMVVLGMTGPRSGSKIALLGIICGGGALIYLTLI